MNKVEVGSFIQVLEQLKDNGITIEMTVEYLILAGDSNILQQFYILNRIPIFGYI